MAAVTGPERKELDKSDYAIPEKAPGPGSYPIPDEPSARSALSRAKLDTESVQSRVESAVKRKFPNISVVDKKTESRRDAIKSAIQGSRVV